MSGAPEKQPAILAAYAEVCRSYHAVDDLRAKLMALLPFASGAGGAFLLAQKEGAGATHLGPLGLFGILVTLGLFFYELRGLKLCGKLITTGEKLELELQLEHGQFQSKPEAKVFGIIGAEAAGYTVYLSVLLGWIYVAWVGF